MYCAIFWYISNEGGNGQEMEFYPLMYHSCHLPTYSSICFVHSFQIIWEQFVTNIHYIKYLLPMLHLLAFFSLALLVRVYIMNLFLRLSASFSLATRQYVILRNLLCLYIWSCHYDNLFLWHSKLKQNIFVLI